jgi:hypothetical protein
MVVFVRCQAFIMMHDTIRYLAVAWCQLVKIYQHFRMSCLSHHLVSRRMPGRSGLDEYMSRGVRDVGPPVERASSWEERERYGRGTYIGVWKTGTTIVMQTSAFSEGAKEMFPNHLCQVFLNSDGGTDELL